MGKVRVLVVGCGNMGASHAKAYNELDGFEIAGLVSRPSEAEVRANLAKTLGENIPEYDDFDAALKTVKPDAVSINTYPDTHAGFAIKSLESGAHVFVEKPLAKTVKEAEEVVAKAKEKGKKVVVGYILRHHPSWIEFVEIARTLGKPLVMRMNLNQQSHGKTWEGHKRLMNSISPIVDCGVHYVDMMCLMTQSVPEKVSAIGARLSDELDPGMYNYGQLQVTFADGSVGWYEAGWGPMMSETAFFVKDVIGPEGCVSIVSPENKTGSDDIDSHTKTNCLRVHSAKMDEEGRFLENDETLNMSDEPDHNELCKREQQYFLKAIREDLDLSQHLQDAVNSLKIVLAADLSFRSGKTITL